MIDNEKEEFWMTDREFLIWIHDRMTTFHHEKPLLDYMHRLRAIILATDKKACNRSGGGNGMADLLSEINRKDNRRWWRFRIVRG